jgi:hypothetical protein
MEMEDAFWKILAQEVWGDKVEMDGVV